MAGLTLSEKIHRCITFLRGLGNPRIAGALAPFGFDQGDLDEGWTLLRAACTTRGAKAAPPAADPTLVDAVDAWENRYFPIVDATLERRYPEIHKAVFLNLSQTSGPPVLVSVQLLLDRLIALDKASDATSKEARALLKKRGITKAVLDEASRLLEQASKIATVDLPDAEETEAEIARAEAALWSWYLEWSKIARAAIKDGRLLIQLGFLVRRTTSGEVIEEPEQPATPDPKGSKSED